MKRYIQLLFCFLMMLGVAVLASPALAEETELSKVFQVYLSGIDNLEELVEESRTDANIIVTVNTETKQILLVHIPRDYFLDFPD